MWGLKIIYSMISLNDIRKPLRKQIQKGIYVSQLKDFILRDGVYFHKHGTILDFNVHLKTKGINLQRPFVWTLEQKQQLIYSLLKGIDIPYYTVIVRELEDKSKIYLIIDGKQRLSTLIDFCHNKFPITINGVDYYYYDFPPSVSNESDLKVNIRYAIDSYHIHFNIVYDYWDDMLTDNELIDWFEQLNFFGTPHDEIHMNNLRDYKCLFNL